MISRLGMEPKILASIINTSSGKCWASEINNPVPGAIEKSPSNEDYQVQKHLQCLSAKRVYQPNCINAQSLRTVNIMRLIHYVDIIIAFDLYMQKGFKANLLLKDMNLGKSLADSYRTPMLLTRETVELYKQVSKKGWGDKDFSIVYKYFKEQEQ